MTKAKKTKTKKKKAKIKKSIIKKDLKIGFIDEIVIAGTIKRNTKTNILDVYEITIGSQDFELEIEILKSLMNIIAENYNYNFQEQDEIFIKMSQTNINQDSAIFLGNCSIYEVGHNYFLGSIGGLKVKLINLSDKIKLFPQSTKIMVGLFKTLEELKKS